MERRVMGVRAPTWDMPRSRGRGVQRACSAKACRCGGQEVAGLRKTTMSPWTSSVQRLFCSDEDGNHTNAYSGAGLWPCLADFGSSNLQPCESRSDERPAVHALLRHARTTGTTLDARERTPRESVLCGSGAKIVVRGRLRKVERLG